MSNNPDPVPEDRTAESEQDDRVEPLVAVDDDHDGRFVFELHFSQTTCDCGAIHPTAIRCRCGAPRGFDIDLERRRAIVSQAFRAVVAGKPDSVPGDPDARAWYRKLQTWLPSLFADCRHIAEAGDGPGTLDATLLSILTLRAELAATPKLRPVLRFWRNLSDMLELFESAADHFARALTEADLDIAQVAWDDGQAAVDTFTAELDEFNQRTEEWEALKADVASSSGVLDPLIRIIELVRGRHAGATLSDFDLAGQPLVERVTGGVSLPSLGAQLLTTEAVAELLLDPDRLWDVAGRTYRELTSPTSTLADVVESAHWQSDFATLSQELVDMEVEVRRATFENPRLAARTFVRLGHLLTERVGKYLLATALAVRPRRDYENERRKDVGGLLGEIDQVGLEGLTFGWDKALRHGDAHGEFEVEEDGVRFTADRREYDFLTWEQLADRVLGAYESVAAVFAGIQCALEATGIDAPDALTTLDVPVAQRVETALALAGWTSVTVEVAETSVDASGVATEHPDSPAFIAAAVAYVPAEITAATFAITSDGGTALWAGPLRPLREFTAETEPLTKVTWFIEAMWRWSVDNQPIWGREQVRGMVAAHLVEQPDTPTDRLAALEPLIALARRIDDRPLHETLATLRSGYQAKRYGRPPGPTVERAADELIGYWKTAQALDVA